MSTEQIRALNDALRIFGVGGRVVFAGSLAQDAMAHGFDDRRIFAAVRAFDKFGDANDPYGEHDFGSFTLDGRAYNWKIDYYDLAEENASPDPADPVVTVRILSVFYAEDY